MARVVYDLLFFFIVIIIVLNLIFGVIIDTFADLRSEKQQKELILKNTCFICGEYNVVILSVGSLLPLKCGTFSLRFLVLLSIRGLSGKCPF